MNRKVHPEVMTEIKRLVSELASLDYPRVWVGEAGMTPEEVLWLQKRNDEGPDWSRVEPGEFVATEGSESGAGIQMPKASYHYLDGLWVLENMPGEVEEHVHVELSREVLYIQAAKKGMVPVIRSFERYQAGHAPDIALVALDDLAPEDAAVVLEALKVYAHDTMGPYIMKNSEAAREAVERRLEN